MPRLLALLFACFLALSTVTAQQQTADSLARRAALLAARGDAEALRPLFKAEVSRLPTYIRLYCQMALARADGRTTELIAYIDTLTSRYARNLGVKGEISLALLKAETLRRQGNYSQLAAYASDRATTFRRRHVKKQYITVFETLAHKGRRLSAPSTRSQVLALADQCLVAPSSGAALKLLALRGQVPSLDGYARLRLRLSVATAFRSLADQRLAADSLLTSYADSLDAEDLRAVQQACGNALVDLGAWKELDSWCRREADMRPATKADLTRFSDMAADFYDHGAASVEVLPHGAGSNGAVVPVTDVWPPLAEGSLNDKDPVLFCINTSVPHTVVTEADAAAAGMYVLTDTLNVQTTAGLLSASPAFAERLQLGDVVFRNILVYVARDADDLPEALVRCVGAKDLSRLASADWYDEKIFLRDGRASAEPARPNLFFTPSGQLLLATAEENSEIKAFLTQHQPHGAQASSGSFMLGGAAARIDFSQMQLTLLPAATALPDTTDALFALRNMDAYMLHDSLPQHVVQTLISSAIFNNQPEALTTQWGEEIAQMRLTADERRHLESSRSLAFALQGSYALASVAVPAGATAEEKAWGRIYSAFPRSSFISVTEGAAEPTFVAFADTAALTFPIGVNGRSVAAQLSFTQPLEVPLVLSRKVAKKLGFTVLTETMPSDKKHSTAYALGSVTVGATTVSNVLCRIVPEDQAPTVVSLALLRHLGSMKFSKDGLTIGAPALAATDAHCILTTPMLVEAETPTGFATVELTTDPPSSAASSAPALSLGSTSIPSALLSTNTQTHRAVLSLPRLLRGGYNLCIDFDGMVCKLVPAGIQ